MWEKIKNSLWILIVSLVTLGMYNILKRDPEPNSIQRKKDIKNAKLKVKIKKAKIKKLEDKRSKLKRKYGKALLILLLLPMLLQAEYIVYDEEDKVYMDYHNTTNYIKYLEEDRKLLIELKDSYEAITTNQTIIMTNQQAIIEENDPAWYEVVWDRTKFFVGVGLGVLLYRVLGS